ncbi:MAG: rhodanese-like domain-containing protein [Actinomycetota bacterium]|nr:MAG: rhodanese-like domain-containing protein [Actinomycetota bacterium]
MDVPEVGVDDLAQALAAGSAHVIDVREPAEFATGRVPGAVLMPLHTVPARLAEIPTDSDVYVVCEVGGRSWQAAAYLVQRGVRATNVAGGTAQWRARGLPLEA